MSNAKDLAALAAGKAPKKEAPNDSAEDSAAVDEEAIADADNMVDMPAGLGEQLDSLGNYLPASMQPYWQTIQQYPLLEALVVVLLFAVIALFVRRYVIKLIERLTSHTETEIDDKVIEEIRGPIFYTIVWIGAIFAIATMDYEFSWLRFSSPIILSIVVLLWVRTGLRVSNIVFNILSDTTAHSVQEEAPAQPLFNLISKIIVLLVGCYCLLLIWGINPVGLLASAGIVGIAVGFAAKDTLANLFSGVFILADRPYEIGDYVNLDNGERGMVTHIGIRSTRIITRDDIEITIPNGVIGNAKVINESGGPDPKIRIRINLLVRYESDVEEICDFLLEIAKNHELICKHPEPSVRIKSFAESGISVQLRGWINKPEQRGRAIHDLSIEVLRAFNKRGLTMPYPQREIMLEQTAKSANDN